MQENWRFIISVINLTILKASPNIPPAKPQAPLGLLRWGALEHTLVQWLERLGLMLMLSIMLMLLIALVFGDGGILVYKKNQKELSAIQSINQAWVARNAKIATELVDLTHGQEIIVEQARYEYLLVREGEDYFRLEGVDKPTSP